ncbi:hypothetical protein BTVI_03794 [Pitangus sulphuratus]|nr:hypothetical protein BTVI_03794 [Pitangus sulphuratus]
MPDLFRADQKVQRVVKAIAQMPFKHWQDGDINHRSRKSIPVFDHPLSEEMLPNVLSEPPWYNFELFSSPVTGYPGEEISTSLSTFSPQEAVKNNEEAPQPTFLDKLRILNCSL